MRTLAIAALLGVGGMLLLTRKQGASQPTFTLPLTRREYADRLANDLEVALSYGDKQMWDQASEECRRIGREDLPEHLREKWPEWAERLDRA
jgi:hypothetical protein